MTEINYKMQTEQPFFANTKVRDGKRKLHKFFKRQPCVCAVTCADKYTVLSRFSSSEDGKYFCAVYSNSYNNVGHLSRFSFFFPRLIAVCLRKFK